MLCEKFFLYCNCSLFEMMEFGKRLVLIKENDCFSNTMEVEVSEMRGHSVINSQIRTTVSLSVNLDDVHI